MKISTIIKELQRIMDEEGDIGVACETDYWDTSLYFDPGSDFIYSRCEDDNKSTT